MGIDRDRAGQLFLGILLGGLAAGFCVHLTSEASRRRLADAFIVHVACCQDMNWMSLDLQALKDQRLLDLLEQGELEAVTRELTVGLRTHEAMAKHRHDWNAELIIEPALARLKDGIRDGRDEDRPAP